MIYNYLRLSCKYMTEVVVYQNIIRIKPNCCVKQPDFTVFKHFLQHLVSATDFAKPCLRQHNDSVM